MSKILNLIWCLCVVALVACKDKISFTLVSADVQKSILVSPDESNFVKLAAEDLISDVEKITGHRLKIVRDTKDCKKGCVYIGSLDNPEFREQLLSTDNNFLDLKGQWESYKVKSTDRDLYIVGSDARGTMFGIYHFIEEYLEVDPLYFWKDREPEKKEVLAWDNVNIEQNEPSFRYRGWFINDEDLLTEWKNGGGTRNIDYPFYSQVVHPDIMGKLVESMVRLRYNLIIPASFIDIKNPPERKLVDIAASRGVFLSMHHIEPLGVSGYTFFNYWKERGKDYKFSYYSHPEALEEVWTEYAKEWSKYENVIWQIGLRGVADRPMWMADDKIPQSDADRGKLISDAMEAQMDIIRSVDQRGEIPVTTTLWMEGSDLNREGHLDFPDGVTVVFSDNSPGWQMQEDFFNTKREHGRKYGIYYHHQLWGTGPHLAQGVPPHKVHEIMKLGKDHKSDDYVVLNVSNIRTFVLGLDASGEMLHNFDEFDPQIFMEEWCAENFGSASGKIQAAYQQYFDSYQMHDQTNAPVLLDGQIRRKVLRLLNGWEDRMKNEEENGAIAGVDMNWTHPYLVDKRCGDLTFQQLEKKVKEQRVGLEKAGEMIEEALSELNDWEKYFLEVNLLSQQKILLGFTRWIEGVVAAVKAYELEGDKTQCREELDKAISAFDLVHKGQAFNSRGEKWKNWYRGETKFNIEECEERTREFLEDMKF
ncbi:glycosyl hydrolase 115 family protein [Membranihabitans maritimus]|uniref:glycosyl hydrolase 115 family protein n=1 Tax=Membranihabitans maritimus TaxID=2904244 RepID=UPI001F3B29BD|nr:glycosyl hydrolase 115 family protein [Membranihabitans maritimus]